MIELDDAMPRVDRATEDLILGETVKAVQALMAELDPQNVLSIHGGLIYSALFRTGIRDQEAALTVFREIARVMLADRHTSFDDALAIFATNLGRQLLS